MAGGNAAFVWAAYGATALAVAALIGRAVLDHRAQSRALARLNDGDPTSGDDRDR